MTISRALKLVLLVVVGLLVCAYAWLKYQIAPAEWDQAALQQHINRPASTPAFAATDRAPCRDNDPLRNAYFGALHVHTSLSGDAAAWGNTVTPAQSYAFARGEPLALHIRGAGAETAPTVQLSRPLDFAAVTDHAEYLAETYLCLTPGSPPYDSTLCRLFRGDQQLPVSERMQPMARMATFALFKDRSARLCGPDGIACLTATESIWAQVQRAAEEAYDRSEECSFTSFVGYEYSLAEDASNLHRNVIFANATVPPIPLSSREAKKPEELWRWLRDTCVDSDTGCNVLAIPHNSNWSSGRMFYPFARQEGLSATQQRELAQLRSELEPLVEIMQVKGDSECRNGLSRVLGGPDELCDFEKLRLPEEPAEDCGDGFGSKGMQLMGCVSRWSFARYGIIEGLREQQLLGVNSLKLGIIAATDNHTGAAGAVEEDRFSGSTGLDRTAQERLSDPVDIPGIARGDTTRYNPGGIAGVWAEENSRESLFNAMKRRETFGTSGPRILPRFFAGWDYSDDLCEDVAMVEQAYANGVPMGGDLPHRPNDGEAKPTFLASALMDSAPNATPLQKIQIIKGWTDAEGNLHQQVIDVAGDTTSTASVDTATCQRQDEGHRSLCAVWRDESFDPNVSAVYYTRVVENPSCRWSTYDCLSLPEAERPAACSNPTLPKAVQERAWTSPIWYTAE